MESKAEPSSSDSPEAVLQVARALIDQHGWCQGAEAVDGAGRPVHPESLQARAWSISGAVYAASRFDGTAERRQILERAMKRVAADLPAPVRSWNDAEARALDDVLAVLDRAIRVPREDHPEELVAEFRC